MTFCGYRQVNPGFLYYEATGTRFGKWKMFDFTVVELYNKIMFMGLRKLRSNEAIRRHQLGFMDAWRALKWQMCGDIGNVPPAEDWSGGTSGIAPAVRRPFRRG